MAANKKAEAFAKAEDRVYLLAVLIVIACLQYVASAAHIADLEGPTMEVNQVAILVVGVMLVKAVFEYLLWEEQE